MKSLRLPFSLSHTTLVLLPLLVGCQATVQPLPGPVRYERSPVPEGGLAQAGTSVSTETQIARLPAVGARPPAAEMASPTAETARAGDGELVSIAIEQTPLPTFVQVLYGSVLKTPYTLDPAVMSRTDPVTFKSAQPLPRARVHKLAEGLLASYGLSVEDLDGLVRIRPAGGQQVGTTVPVLRSAEAAADSNERRPVFHYIELQVVKVADMTQWLRQMVGSRVNLQEDANRNSFLLSGSATDVRSVIELTQVMDQPRLRGRAARRFTPANIAAQELASRLSEVLGAQGYSAAVGAVGSAAVLVLPIPSIGGVIVFAHNDEVMNHVQRWVLELDRPSQNTGSNSPLFTYAVKFADAQELARTLGELLGGGGAQVSGSGSGQTASGARASSGGRVVVNNATNTLIIRGTGADEQQQIRQLLRELDRPTKSAMIEVMVAELAVGELDRLGVQWSSLDSGGSIFNRSVQFANGALSMTYASSARQIQAAINALATADKGRILSNPKVMARNGETATISVGREVPVLTGQQTTLGGSSPIGGGTSTGVLQTIQYRNTGVNLKVRPVINSGNRLDLEISQEVSSVATGETGVGSNPIISNRKIDTKLSLRDGSTVLLGGLISRNTSTSDSGVPLLKDIPGLGAAFRNRTGTANQTELMVMITPYVINDDFEAEEITAAMQKTFGDWAADVRASRTAPRPVGAAVEDPSSTMLPVPSVGPAVSEESPQRQESVGAIGNSARKDAAAPPSSPLDANREGSGQKPPPPAPVIELSRPSRSSPQPASTPVLPPAGKKDDAAPSSNASAGAARPVLPGKGGVIDTPAGPGRPVTDPKVLEELKRAIERNKQ